MAPIQMVCVLHNKPDLLRETLQEQDIDINMAIVDEDEVRDRYHLFIPGSTTLIIAVELNRTEIIDMLIDMGCDIDASDVFGQTALMHACFRGNLALVNRLLDAGANVNHQDIRGGTPLFLASFNGNTDIVRLLLAAKGINPDEVNQDPETRAEMNRLSNYGHSLLMHAVTSGFCTPEIIQLLVNIGCNVNQVGREGKTPLLIVADEYKPLAQNVRALIDHGANVNVADGDGKTPLMRAAIQNHPSASVLNVLLDAGANKKALDNNGLTALIHAMSRENIDVDAVQVLLHNADRREVNPRNQQGWSVLEIAVCRAELEVVRMLLSVDGININMRKCREAAAVAPAAVMATAAATDDHDNDPEGSSSDNNDSDNNDSDDSDSDNNDSDNNDSDDNDLDDNDSNNSHSDKVEQCLREVAATVIQRQWRECYWNPNYIVCRKRLMEEGESMERDVKRLRRE